MPDPVNPSPSAPPPSITETTRGMTLAEGLNAIAAGQSTPPSTTPKPTQPGDGQATVAPASGQGDGTGKPKESAGAEPGNGQAAPVQPKPEDILAELGTKETPDAELARLRRDSGASRAEALRLKKVVDGMSSLLGSQHLEIVFDQNGEPRHLAPGKDYADGKANEFSLKFTDLTEEQQKRAETEPQSLIDLAIGRARKAFIRAMPTIEKAIQPISQEQEMATIGHVEGLLYQDGQTKKHPNVKENMPLIKQFLAAPENQALRDFYNQQPHFALGMLDSYVEMVKNFLASSAQKAADAKAKKDAEAGKTFLPGPQGGGEPAIIPAGASVEEQGKAYAKAFGAARPY